MVQSRENLSFFFFFLDIYEFSTFTGSRTRVLFCEVTLSLNKKERVRPPRQSRLDCSRTIERHSDVPFYELFDCIRV